MLPICTHHAKRGTTDGDHHRWHFGRRCEAARRNSLDGGTCAMIPNRKTILIALIVVGMAALALRYQVVPRLNPNAGFGSDWDCTWQAKGDPVCIKKLHSR